MNYVELPTKLDSVEWNSGHSANLVKTITGFQAELDRQIRGENSQFYQRFLKARSMVMRLFGRTELNPYQLLNLQIAASRDLVESFSPLKTHAHASLNDIGEYIDARNLRYNLDTKQIKEGSQIMEDLTKEYGKQEQLLVKLESGSDKWYDETTRYRALKRELNDADEAYLMAQFSGYLYRKTIHALSNFEDFLTDSLKYSKQVEMAALTYVELLEHSIPILGNIAAQEKYNSHVEHAIGSLSNGTEKLVDCIENGADSILSAHQKTVDAHKAYGNLEEKIRRIREGLTHMGRNNSY